MAVYNDEQGNAHTFAGMPSLLHIGKDRKWQTFETSSDEFLEIEEST